MLRKVLAHSRCSRKLSFKECWRILGDEMTGPTKEPPRRADLWVPGKAFGHGREILGHRVRKKNARTALCPVGPGGRAAALTAGASACGHRQTLRHQLTRTVPGLQRAGCLSQEPGGGTGASAHCPGCSSGPGSGREVCLLPAGAEGARGREPFPGPRTGKAGSRPRGESWQRRPRLLLPEQPRRPRAHEA